MKLKIIDGRYIMDTTRLEALLIKDSMLDFAMYRSEGLDWDSTMDPIVVSQINRVLDKLE